PSAASLLPPALALYSLTESVRFPFHAEPTQDSPPSRRPIGLRRPGARRPLDKSPTSGRIRENAYCLIQGQTLISASRNSAKLITRSLVTIYVNSRQFLDRACEGTKQNNH